MTALSKFEVLPQCEHCGHPLYESDDILVGFAFKEEELLDMATKEDLFKEYGRKVAYSFQHWAQAEYCKRNGHKPEDLGKVIRCTVCGKATLKEDSSDKLS